MSRLVQLSLASALLLAGCVPPAPVGYVPPAQVVASYPPVPAARVEVVPPPPPRREVWRWQPGHWHWNGQGYEWIAGRYVERTVGATRWEPGHWTPRPGGYAWVPGRWV